MRSLCTAVILFTLCLALGCSRRADSHHWVHGALEANLLADQALQNRDRDAAVASLRRVVESGVPGSVAASDARVVRQDACFRLAIIELDADRPQEALRWSDRGLELGRSTDLFTANLLVVHGRASQRQGREVQAAKDYHQALLINELLLNRALPPHQERNLP